MQIKNRVIVNLEDGKNLSFNTKSTLDAIKKKYSPGSLFLGSESFFSGVISSMTCYSIKIETKN